MAYIFPDNEYMVYSKTFLKDVQVRLDFPCMELGIISAPNVSQFFKNKFNFNDNDITIEDIKKGFIVYTDDEQIQFDFGIEKVIITMKCPTYKSFDLALSLIEIVEEYLSILHVSKVSKLIISKYDELEFKNNRNYTMLNVMKNVFHNNLLTTINNEKENPFKELVRWEKVLSFEGGDDTNSNLFIEFGFSLRGTERQHGALTLKTQISSRTIIETEKIKMVSKDYNRILDNAFHWCIRPEIIDIMKKS